MTRTFRFGTRVLLTAALCILLSAPLASAQTQTQQNCATGANGFVPLACVSNSSKLGDLYSSADLSSYINGVFKFALVIGAMAAVLRLSYAGYLYMGQADMWSKKGEARAIIGDVTLGLLLLLSVWLILYQINPDILSLSAIKNITPVQTSGGKAGG